MISLGILEKVEAVCSEALSSSEICGKQRVGFLKMAFVSGNVNFGNFGVTCFMQLRIFSLICLL